MSFKIGICDDEVLIAEKLKEIISVCLREINQEAEITVFLSGKKLLEKIKELDVVFLDIRMEELDGYETGKLIKKIKPDCQIIMETGESERFEEAFEIGAVRYIRKPFDKEKITEALRKVVGGFRGNKTMELYKDRSKF